MAPSGAFGSTDYANLLPVPVPIEALSPRTDITFNPGVLEIYRGSYTQTSAIQLPEKLVHDLKAQDHIITEAALMDYAKVMRFLCAELLAHPSDCNLAPLRGARLPSLLVETMTASAVTFEPLDYHNGANRVRAGEQKLREDIRKILKKKNRRFDTFLLSVVDVVEGGYGMEALVDVLKEIKDADGDFSAQHWLIRLQLLHATPLNPRLVALNHRYDDGITVIAVFHPVMDTLVEDFDDALGFALETGAGYKYLKPCARGGRFLYRGPEGLAVVESEDLFLAIQEFAAQAVTLDLITDPSKTMVANRWDDYTRKG